MRCGLLTCLGVAAAGLVLTAMVRPQPLTAQSPAAGRPAAAARPSAAPDAAAALLNQYCVSCHSARLKTGGVAIDPAGLGNVGADADTWEKVVRKLRTTSMPPPGLPRPDGAAYAAAAARLESALDRAWAAHPAIGSVPLVRRLTRTEYQNAVRDLLGIDTLPREASIELMLPADNVSSGFDNIADLLFVSPSSMERYLDAAQKISRLAVGDPAMPVMVNIYTLDPEHPQDERVDELPFGTRGGIAIRSDFPVDGTYVVTVEPTGGGRDAQQLEVTVDGARVQLETLGGAAAAGRGAGRGGGGRGGSGNLEYRLPIKAGPRTIGVTYVQRTEARDESTLRPRTRSRGTQPAIARVTIRGPYDVTGPGDSETRRRIFVCRPATAAEETPCARRIVSTLARRAYRRPIGDVDLDDLMPFYRAGREEGSFDLGIERALERLLVSSQFLFRIEKIPATAAPGAVFRVSDLELASRLAFFIWSSGPDDELLELGAAGRLKDPKVLETQVRRLLADPRADALVSNFASQWLYLRDIDLKQPDEVLFQDFDETLRQAMRRETEMFVGSIFREPRSVVDLLTANYTFLNERLARHYGIPNVRGSYFRRVTLPGNSPRGGLLGQGSLLTITSYANRTSPVLRGKWVLENLLSSPPPPPPPDVPSLKTDSAETRAPLTMREAMVRHRANPACAGCHARMDPIGFALENFDAVGRWRDQDAGTDIDASGTFPDGATFAGVAGLRRELLRQQAQFVETLASRLLMYAVGRNLQYYDAPAVRRLVREAAADRYTFASLVRGVVNSQPFQMRQAGSK